MRLRNRGTGETGRTRWAVAAIALLPAALLTVAVAAGCAGEPRGTATATAPAAVATAPPETSSPPPATPMPPSAPPTAPPPPATATPSFETARMRCPDASADAAGGYDLGDVLDKQGYALAPTALPQGFAFAGISSGLSFANQLYQNQERIITIAYPLQFDPEDSPVMRQLGILRPEGAIAELQFADQTAYAMIGGWSDATILAGPGINPSQAKWDYNRSLALFFKCGADDGAEIEVAVQALPSPDEWIGIAELVAIAQSLRRLTP